MWRVVGALLAAGVSVEEPYDLTPDRGAAGSAFCDHRRVWWVAWLGGGCNH